MASRPSRSRHSLFKSLGLLFGLLLASTIAFSETNSSSRQAYVITLQQQVPENLVSAIQPLLAEGDAVTGFGNELIVTTTADRIGPVRQLVERLDKPLRNLLITVKANNQADSLDRQRGFSGGIQQGDVLIHTGEPVRRPKDAITVYSDGLAYSQGQRQGQSSKRIEQQIRAVEGSPAFIYTGQSIKLPSVDPEGHPYTVEADALQGIYVTARLAGNRVQLTISASNDRFSDKSRGQQILIDTQQLSTTISGAQNQWIDLGGITLGEQNQEETQVKKTTSRSGSVGNISVKITALD